MGVVVCTFAVVVVVEMGMGIVGSRSYVRVGDEEWMVC